MKRTIRPTPFLGARAALSGLPFLLLACGAAPPPAAAPEPNVDTGGGVEERPAAALAGWTEIVLHDPADNNAKVGDVRVQEEDMTAAMTLDMRTRAKQWQVTTSMKKRVQKRMEYIEIVKDKPVRWEVVYSVFSEEKDGKASSGLVLGKTYRVDVSVEPTAITNLQGRAVSTPEREAVMSEEVMKRKAHKQPMAAGAPPPARSGSAAPPPPHATHIGEAVPAYAQYLKEELGSAAGLGDVKVDVKTARLDSIQEVDDEPCGVIGLDVGMGLVYPGGAHAQFRMKGETVLRARDGVTLSLSLAGPLVLSGEMQQGGEKVSISGKGTARLRVRSHWEKHGAI